MIRWFCRVIASVVFLHATGAAAAPADEAQVEALAARVSQHDRKIDTTERNLREQTEEFRAARARFENWLRGHEERLRVDEDRLRQLDNRLTKIDQGFNNTAARLAQGEKRVDGAIDELREQQLGTERRLIDLLTSRTAGIGAAILAVVLVGAVALVFLRSALRAAQSGLGARAEMALSSIRSAEERLAQADTKLVEALTQQLIRTREMAAASTPQAAVTGALDGARERSGSGRGSMGGAGAALDSAGHSPGGEAGIAAGGAAGSAAGDARERRSHEEELRSAPVDHTLAIRLADEVHRMRRRLASLPEETRGLVPLRRSIERLEAELASHGYDLVDPIGRPFVDGLTMEARFVSDESLAAGQRVISKVIVPQVNYRGALVRMAEVEVSLGA